MKTLEELLAIKAKAQANITTRESADGSEDVTRIVVGMATCGIAAGARPVLNGFVEGLSNIVEQMIVTVIGSAQIGFDRGVHNNIVHSFLLS